MNIGIIGTGQVGRTLATKLAALGHQVCVANSRGPESVAEILGAQAANLTPCPTSETLKCAVIFLTVPWTKVEEVLAAHTPEVNQILVDATNIFLTYPPEATVADLKGDSGSEIIARAAPKARVVKAFNTLSFDMMFSPVPEGMKRVLFVAGDEDDATATVSTLIEELGLHPVLLGSLAQAGRQMELGGPLSALNLLKPS